MQVTSTQPLDVALPTTGDACLVQIPVPSIQVDANWHAQFHGPGDININLSMLPIGNLQSMHSMITDELQYIEATNHIHTMESQKQAVVAHQK